MRRFLSIILLVIISSTSYASTFQLMESNSLDALRKKDYANAIRYCQTALQSIEKINDGNSRKTTIILRMACAYVEQGDYDQALKACKDAMNRPHNRDQTEMANYLQNKVIARTCYNNGIRNLRDIYKKSSDPLVSFDFLLYATEKDTGSCTVANMITQMVFFIQTFGYSKHASVLTLNLSNKLSKPPVKFFELLAQRLPELNKNADFMFDYATCAGVDDPGTQLRCLNTVIDISKDPRQTAESLFLRYSRNIAQREPERARKDLDTCKVLVEKNHFSDMQIVIKEGYANVDRLVKYMDANNIHRNNDIPKKLLSIFSYFCIALVVSIVGYRLRTLLKTT